MHVNNKAFSRSGKIILVYTTRHGRRRLEKFHENLTDLYRKKNNKMLVVGHIRKKNFLSSRAVQKKKCTKQNTTIAMLQTENKDKITHPDQKHQETEIK